jgi:DNA-directed RNA polymerase omega subunit
VRRGEPPRFNKKETLVNKFEFVVVSGARAKQLQAGCTPRVEKDSNKPARVAMKEVKTGKVEKLRPLEATK